MLARAYLSLFRERNALMSFLFHSLFRDEREIRQNLVDPLQRTTVAQFRQFIAYYLENGYRFVSPDDLLDGLGPEGKYALITFDDGYFNNTLALPVLEEFGVPAVFFVSTGHVHQGKCFWWDVLHRELSATGASPRTIYREATRLKVHTTEQIEAMLTERFGPGAFTPRGDIDRPFTPSELRDFAGHPRVHLGNHTADHAILTNYSPEQVREQIVDAQESLRAMAGVSPSVIAYPNGAHTGMILRTCDELGMKAGFTIRPEKNALPLGPRPPPCSASAGSPRTASPDRHPVPHVPLRPPALRPVPRRLPQIHPRAGRARSPARQLTRTDRLGGRRDVRPRPPEPAPAPNRRRALLAAAGAGAAVLPSLAAAPPTAASGRGPFLDVRDFRAVGDGVHDDTAAAPGRARRGGERGRRDGLRPGRGVQHPHARDPNEGPPRRVGHRGHDPATPRRHQRRPVAYPRLRPPHRHQRGRGPVQLVGPGPHSRRQPRRQPRAGCGLRVYGWGYTLRDLRIRQCGGTGIYTEWSTDDPPGRPAAGARPATRWKPSSSTSRSTTAARGACGFRGPHDTQIVNVVVYGTKTVGIHLESGPRFSATGCQLVNTHVWGGHVYGVRVDAGYVTIVNCTAEWASQAQVHVNEGDTTLSAGRFFGDPKKATSASRSARTGASRSTARRSTPAWPT